MRIGICDTTFARYDMAAAAIDELKQFGNRFSDLLPICELNCFGYFKRQQFRWQAMTLKGVVYERQASGAAEVQTGKVNTDRKVS